MINQNQSTQSNTHIQFLNFYIDKNFFGINILDIKEIIQDFELLPIFHAPNGVRGYVNLRGQIYLIIDLRLSLGITSNTSEKTGKLILVKDRIAGQTGIIVDKIGDIITVDHKTIEIHTETKKKDIEEFKKNNLVSGVCKLKDNLMVILNINNILDLIKT